MTKTECRTNRERWAWLSQWGIVFSLMAMLISCCTVVSYASSNKYVKHRLAVLTFDSKNLDAGTVQAVTEYVQSCFENTGLFVVVERNRIEQVLHEQSFQLSGLVDNATIGSLGKVLGASRLVFGSINRMGNVVVISARIVDSETGEIAISGTENGKESEINHNVQRLVRSLVKEDRSKFQAYLRSLTYTNSLRVKTDFAPFTGTIAMLANSESNYDISYRRKGIPFLMTDNWCTEFEIGNYVTEGSAVLANGNHALNHVQDNPFSINLQYYLPVSFLQMIYFKAGGGISYRTLKQTSWGIGGKETTTTLLKPIGKIGLGIDIAKHSPLSFQIEGIYNHFSTQSEDPKEPNRVTLNIGASYNW